MKKKIYLRLAMTVIFAACRW